jgi:serine/threonine-protein kinase RsbW
LVSCVAASSKGEIVGHLGLTFETPEAKVCESGIAIVDTRYRGMGIFKRMREYLQGYAKENEIIGIYGEAVTIHPFTQKGVAKFGAKEVGFLLGYTPGEIVVKDIEVESDSRRQSIALMYTPVTYKEQKTVYLPLIYHDFASRIYKEINFKRELTTSDLPIGESRNNLGTSDIVMRKDYDQVFIIIEEYGRDTVVEINFVLRQMCTLRMDCIYVDLPLFDPHAPYVISKLRESGFFIGGIIPELRNGDVLRVQYLNNVQIMKRDIKVASEFGEYVLKQVFDDKDDIELNSLKENL